MKDPNSTIDSVRSLRPLSRIGPPDTDGIVVQEDELSSATAQLMYRMRCDCGRSWFDLELKALVKCPGCAKLNRVQLI